MRVVACTVAVLLCLLPAGCRMFGKKQAAAPGKDAAGDPGLRADRTTPPPAFDRTSPPPGVNGMLVHNETWCGKAWATYVDILKGFKVVEEPFANAMASFKLLPRWMAPAT